jgi:hypothetical protein
LEQQGDPVEFLGWLLNHLHKDMGGSKKKNSSKLCSIWNIKLTNVVARHNVLDIPGRRTSGNTTGPCAAGRGRQREAQV